jgi:hypothetical protein
MLGTDKVGSVARLASGGMAQGRNTSGELAMFKCFLAAFAGLLIGCNSATETGYEPRKLGDSETVQRGYYATPFSPESRAAQAEQRQKFEGFDSGRRPGDWRPSPY